MSSRLLRAAAALALAAMAVAAAVLLPHSPAGLRELLLSAGAAAPVAALAAWVLLTPALFPGTVLAAAGGLAFGAVGGAALAFGGAVAGGVAAFALARTAARGPAGLVARSARLSRIDALLARRGFAAILAARLTPGVPAAGLHYVAGVSRVRARSFVAAMAVAAPLRTVPYAVLGTGLASGSIVTLVIAAGSIAVGGIASAVLVRRVLGAAPAGA